MKRIRLTIRRDPAGCYSIAVPATCERPAIELNRLLSRAGLRGKLDAAGLAVPDRDLPCRAGQSLEIEVSAVRAATLAPAWEAESARLALS